MLLTLVIKQLALYYLIIINKTLFLIKMTWISKLQACSFLWNLSTFWKNWAWWELGICWTTYNSSKKCTCPLTLNFDQSGQKQILVAMVVTTLTWRMLYLSSEQALGGVKLRNNNNLGNTTVVQGNPDFLEIILPFTYNHKAEIR